MGAHKHYREMWVKAGYDTNIGSAWVTPPPPPEYRRVYHLTGAEYALSNLWFRRLKVARFNELNDPFELLAFKLGIEQYRKKVKALRDAFANEIGLVCFSGNWISPVLWGHYANKHRGICLGFDLARSQEHKVDYMTKRLEVTLEKYPTAEDLPPELREKLFCTKSADWRYEDEYRMLVPLANAETDGSLHYIPFSPDLRLAEVILGEDCPLPLEKVRDIVGTMYPGAVVISARLAWNHFSVVPKESTIPD
jgi:hypothetical protein